MQSKMNSYLSNRERHGNILHCMNDLDTFLNEYCNTQLCPALYFWQGHSVSVFTVLFLGLVIQAVALQNTQ